MPNASDFLHSTEKFHIKLGLERISEALKILDNPQDNLKCIHVAGTNGKGSVCTILASILQEYGLKVGLYTSPHIYDYTERIKINGEQISEEDFEKYVFMASEADKNLTEFEILTIAMFKYFYDNKVDIVVLETGLGGRLDATNVIKKNMCAIITHIDFDHTERLGSTLQEIMREKEGIIKPGCPVIRNLPPVCNENLALKGKHQEENLALALEALKILYPNMPQNTIDEGLKKVSHPARFQLINENLIIDGAHNPNGTKALRENLDLYFPNRKRRFIFGCLKNKDYKKMMKILFNEGDEIYFYTFNNPNAATFEELQSSYRFPAQKFESISNDNHLTIVCGSIYMISEIIPRQLLH